MGNITWDFKDKVVVITGAATGIGRGTAFAFAKAGAKLALCDFNVEEVTNTTNKCIELGAKAFAYRMDVTKVEEIKAAREKIVADFGTIDILFSNAGISSKVMGPPFEEIPDWDWENTFAANTFGMVRVCREFTPIMKEKKEGKIILTSSIAAFNATPRTMPYSASKIGCISFGQSLAVEMGAYNVNVNILCPGFVYTNIYSDGTAIRFRDAIGGPLAQFEKGEDVMNALSAASAPLKRSQTVEDMANAIMFLSSEEAKEITGQVLNVDSGYTRR